MITSNWKTFGFIVPEGQFDHICNQLNSINVKRSKTYSRDHRQVVSLQCNPRQDSNELMLSVDPDTGLTRTRYRKLKFLAVSVNNEFQDQILKECSRLRRY